MNSMVPLILCHLLWRMRTVETVSLQKYQNVQTTELYHTHLSLSPFVLFIYTTKLKETYFSLTLLL